MKFDELLFSHLGEMGKYQRLQFLLVCLPTIFTAMHALSWTFAAISIPHRCALEGEDKYSDFATLSPLISSSCKTEDGSAAELSAINETGVSCKVDECMLKDGGACSLGWVYDRSAVQQSAIGRWDIVCDRASIKALVQAFYYAGQMAGSMTFGVLGDKIGRKKVFMMAIGLQLACGLLMAVAPTWWLYALFRAGTGFSHPGIFVIAVVIGMELVGPSYRKLASVITGGFFSLGQVILGTAAYFFTDYAILHVVITSPAFFFLLYWWLVPESPRWLVSQKRYAEADVVLQKAARMNGVILPENWWTLLDQEDASESKEKKVDAANEGKEILAASSKSELAVRSYSFLDLFRTPQLRKRTLTVFFLWPVISMVYYGLSMKSDVFGGNLYVNFIAGGFIEMPALFLVFLIVDRVGRRILLAGGLATSGLCLLSNLFLPDDAPKVVAVAQLLVTKGAITAVYATIYTFSPELFPTVVRNTAMGCCSTIARVGAITASFVAMWIVERMGRAFMIIPFGALSLIAAFLTVTMLPETMGRPLPESIEQIEEGEAQGTEMQTLSATNDE